MSKIQSELEQSFSKYQCALVLWNQSIGDLHDAQKLDDSLENRINLNVKNQALRTKYDEYKKTLKVLQNKILEKHHCKPNWNECNIKESDSN